MLYLVKMDVIIPSHLPTAEVEAAKATEKARSQELQRVGRWVHLWRVVAATQTTQYLTWTATMNSTKFCRHSRFTPS